jgi:single-stranded-DNA-specific exonuclease
MTSFLGKKWVIKNAETGLSLAKKLLTSRGITTPEQEKMFFEGNLSHIPDPLLLKDMEKAVSIIQEAVTAKKSIMIFGDYDVDGITGTVILYDFLKKIGANVRFTLPHRENDGYGLKSYFIQRFAEEKVDLLITVDCGTSNLEEITLAKKLGLTVIVTDHHSMPAQLPPADALVNPKRPDCEYINKELSGAGIAFKLMTALAPHYLKKEEIPPYLERMYSVVALGLVGDCMAITGENRILVREGLRSMAQGKHPGLSALLEIAGVERSKVSSTTIGFQIGPRLNAAGRMDTPVHALELLLGDTSKASVLHELNKKRQVLIEDYMNEAVAQISLQKSVPGILAVHSAEWRTGLVGLIASRLCEKYQRPAIAMHDLGDDLVGSFRSVEPFDMTAALRNHVELFASFGGHAQAGGFTLPKKNFEAFSEAVTKLGDAFLSATPPEDLLEIDSEITAEELTMAMGYKLEAFKPYGNGNEEPTLVLKGARIQSIRPVGKTGEHLQLPISVNGKTFKAIAFRFGTHADKIDPTRTYDVAFNLEINEWNGSKSLQLKVVDLK